MLVCVVLLLMIVYNLFNVVTEEQSSFYKDFRFWLVLFSLAVLVWIAVERVYV